MEICGFNFVKATCSSHDVDYMVICLLLYPEDSGNGITDLSDFCKLKEIDV